MKDNILNKHLPVMLKEIKSFIPTDKELNVIDATFELIGKSIKKDKRFSYPAFGTFTVRNRKARKGRNPQTGEEIKIKASRTVGFKPAPTLKGSL